jgi:hypothetical protein
MDERRELGDRRHLPWRGRRTSDPNLTDGRSVEQMTREVARQKTAVAAIARTMETHAAVVRDLADAVQSLTGARRKPRR